MSPLVILASSSQTRSILLNNAGINHEVSNAVIDEESVKASLILEGVSPRDIADILAEMKAKKVSPLFPDLLTIGCDQVLAFRGAVYSKPKTKTDMISQLNTIKGNKHEIFSAAVIYRGGSPMWRYVGRTEITLRDVSLSYIKAYVEKHWETTKNCVGGYEIERNGVKIVKRIDGDFFNILGMPLLEILNSTF